MPGKLLNSVLVKPAGPDCNLACDYCFYTCKSDMFPKTKIHRMSEKTLTAMLRQLMAQAGEEVGIGWQGGEPTLIGLGFFQKAMDLMVRFGRNLAIGNGLQTNGLLIDRDWTRFLRQYNFLVGLSLDGPRHIHDRYRRTRDGKGTWETVVDRSHLLLDSGVAVNALSVVTKDAADYPEEIYGFLKEHGLDHMQFIPCVECDPANPETLMPYSVSSEKYGKFLCVLFDLWLADFDGEHPTTSIRFFDALFYRYVGLAPPDCSLQEACGTYLVVEHTGDVYSCDFFVEPEWHLGNIHQNRLEEMLNSEKQSVFGAMKKDLPTDCANCRWLTYCTGGCTRCRPSPDRPDFLCAAYKRFFEHAHHHMARLAETWRQNHRNRAV